MKIPQEIQKVLNNREYFDVLFLKEVKRKKGTVTAFNDVVKRIQDYAPHFVMYTSFESYKAMYYKRTTKDEDIMVEVPEDIIYAVTKGIDQLMHENIKKIGVRKLAYDMTVSQINKYFPDYKPFKNYQSYKSSSSIAHKKNKNK